MGMRKYHVEPLPFFGEQAIPKPADSGACIDDDDFVPGRPDLQARSITAVTEIFRSGNRNGAPCPPTANNHEFPFTLFLRPAMRQG